MTDRQRTLLALLGGCNLAFMLPTLPGTLLVGLYAGPSLLGLILPMLAILAVSVVCLRCVLRPELASKTLVGRCALALLTLHLLALLSGLAVAGRISPFHLCMALLAGLLVGESLRGSVNPEA